KEFGEAIRLKPGEFAYHANRAWAYNLNKEPQQALNDCDAALKLPGGKQDALTWNERGLALTALARQDQAQAKMDMAGARLEQAVAAFTEAIQLAPKMSTYYSNRAYAWNLIQNSAAAVDDCNKALELNAKNAMAYNERGLALGHTGKYAQAIQDFVK